MSDWIVSGEIGANRLFTMSLAEWINRRTPRLPPPCNFFLSSTFYPKALLETPKHGAGAEYCSFFVVKAAYFTTRADLDA
ncbi:hypothetical protein TH25_03260 [Thalassospira profundimaris]|uniref:Uncharacterized protein n=1 Tax=Thalassospira profundimaris TaxID=502049 RepID=A0A367XIV8_9PROT|nr:hypothetical protein TH25_03260 [Thalassospira profundimaris]